MTGRSNRPLTKVRTHSSPLLACSLYVIGRLLVENGGDCENCGAAVHLHSNVEA